MEENSQNNGSDYSNNELENLNLAYEYTEKFLAQCNKNIDDLNARLTTFLGFGGLLLRFGIGLPDGCRSCLLLKILVLCLSALSVSQSSYGLIANKIGETVKPKALMSDKWFQDKNLKVKASITNTWIESVEQLEESATKKQDQLNRSIFLLAAAVILVAINSIIATSFPECF
jgi:hypothetical protein